MEKNALKFVWHYVKIFKWILALMLVLLVAGQLCRQFVPYFMARIYETVSTYADNPGSGQSLLYFILMTFVMLFVGQAVANGNYLFIAKMAPKLRTIVIRDVFDYVNRHSIAYFSEEMAGNISNKVQQLQNGVSELFRHSLDSVWSVLYAFVAFCVLSWVSWWLAPFFILWAAIMVLLGLFLGRKINRLSKESASRQSTANGMIVDSLANYSEIKSFANFRFERLNLLKALRMLRKAETREEFNRALVIFLQHSSVVFSVFAFLLYTAGLFVSDKIDATGFIFVNGLFTTLSGLIFNVTWVYHNLLRIFGQISSALETLAVDPEIVDSPHARKLKIKKADITFQNVGFAYNSGQQIFRNLNLRIRPGEKIGLVGASGAGKSTFIKLLARYFDVTEGAVLINGIDIRQVTQDSLHKNIATIPQDVCLFNRSLYDNIRYGKTSATRAEIVVAAKKASADAFIRRFPEGYDTKVGDRGVILSGGERQRIAIARAVLKNAPILIFDEATSALDSENEKHIQTSLARLMKGKTVIAVAHRLSTLREMDRILVFHKGKIVEEGNHEELIRRGGRYAKLFKMQSDGFVK